jgi:hypothetical protein
MGHPPVDLHMQTSLPGLFAIGSARQGSSGQISSVARDGVTAAISSHRYIPQNRVVNTWCALTDRACDTGGKPFLIAISRTLEVEVLKNT